MFNPLDVKIKLLLQEIAQLEVERESVDKRIRHMYPLARQRQETIDRIQPDLETIERLTSTIDSKRQELIATELQLLDDSIKNLRATTGQVDGSVKSLQITTDKLLKSSTKLERLTTILLWATLFIGVATILQVSVTLYSIDKTYGTLAIAVTGVGLVVLGIFAIPVLRRLSRG